MFAGYTNPQGVSMPPRSPRVSIRPRTVAYEKMTRAVYAINTDPIHTTKAMQVTCQNRKLPNRLAPIQKPKACERTKPKGHRLRIWSISIVKKEDPAQHNCEATRNDGAVDRANPTAYCHS